MKNLGLFIEMQQAFAKSLDKALHPDVTIEDDTATVELKRQPWEVTPDDPRINDIKDNTPIDWEHPF